MLLKITSSKASHLLLLKDEKTTNLFARVKNQQANPSVLKTIGKLTLISALGLFSLLPPPELPLFCGTALGRAGFVPSTGNEPPCAAGRAPDPRLSFAPGLGHGAPAIGAGA